MSPVSVSAVLEERRTESADAEDILTFICTTKTLLSVERLTTCILLSCFLLNMRTKCKKFPSPSHLVKFEESWERILHNQFTADVDLTIWYTSSIVANWSILLSQLRLRVVQLNWLIDYYHIRALNFVIINAKYYQSHHGLFHMIQWLEFPYIALCVGIPNFR